MQLYDLIKKVSLIITPETDDFYNYVLFSSDDNGGFLRTRYCMCEKPLKDRTLRGDYKKVLVASEQIIDVGKLKCRNGTPVKLQFEYWNTNPTFDDAEFDLQLGYCYVYLFDLEAGKYRVEYFDPLY